jgi:hypothetical protein
MRKLATNATTKEETSKPMPNKTIDNINQELSTNELKDLTGGQKKAKATTTISNEAVCHEDNTSNKSDIEGNDFCSRT